MTVIIREAESFDIPAIACVHVASWQEAYRGFMPDGVIESFQVADRERLWRAAMSEAPAAHGLFVADVAGEIVGFGGCGLARDPLLGTQGEVSALYVLKRWQCRGIGGRLMGAMASCLIEREIASVGMWVARDNMAAIVFFRALCGRLGAARMRGGEGFAPIEMALMWQDASDLAFWDDRTTARREPSRRPQGCDGRSRSGAAKTARPDACRPA